MVPSRQLTRSLPDLYPNSYLIEPALKRCRPLSTPVYPHLLSARVKLTCSQNVPVIFICHSFGGIILKEAFCLPVEGAREIADLASGILFLGTPHQGSPVSSLGAVAAGISRILGSQPGLLLSLRHHQAQLADLEDKFCYRIQERQSVGKKIGIYTFYEQKATFMMRWFSVGLVRLSKYQVEI